MTGGGPAPVQQTDAVMAFMDATNSNIDVEIDCPYDSTAIFEKESKHKTGRVPLAHIPIAHIHSHRPVLRIFPLDHQSENFILN